MSSLPMASNELPMPDQADLEDVWADSDGWIVATGGRHSNKRIHLQDGDKPLCHMKAENWEDKDCAIYPIGHKPLCRYCFAIWQDG